MTLTRFVTPARLRAVGILLLEAAGVAVLFAKYTNTNPELKTAVTGFFKKLRAFV